MSLNRALAREFEAYADLLDAEGEDFRARSYRDAAERLRDLAAPIEERAAEGVEALQEIHGIGSSIAAKIAEYVETGEIEALETARDRLPVNMRELTAVEGVGPKTVGTLYRELGVTTLDELEAAAREGRIREIEGFGETSEGNILDNVAFARQATERERLGDVLPVAEAILDHLRAVDGVVRCETAGSIRRWSATIGDVDVLASGPDHAAIVDRLLALGGAEAIEAGTEKASVRVDDIRVDLRVVDDREFGSALQHFTGSKAHNIRLRNYAIERGYKINEYGIFDVRDVPDPDAGQRVGVRVGGETEAEVYETLGLEPMPPELREDRGEIEAAAEGTLPTLIDEGGVLGDLHVHSDRSDGNATIEEMVDAAAAFGHEYVCIADHASGPGVVGSIGLDDIDLREQLKIVREIGDDAEIEVFVGVEANIGTDGSISVADDVLADLDLVIASPHAGLDGDGTDRLVAAIEHPHVDVIGHPSGRLINRRQGLELDLDVVAEAAAANDTALEVNANPARLDLWGSAVRLAVDAGARIAVDTDAHSPAEYENVRYGVHTARRGWAEPADVINAWDAADLRTFLGRG